MSLYQVYILFQKMLLYYLGPFVLILGVLLFFGVYPTVEKILSKDIVVAPKKFIPRIEEENYKLHNWLLRHNLATAAFLVACAIFFFIVGKSKDRLIFLYF